MLKSSGTAVEFINLDPKAKKVTVLGDRGLKRVFVVDDKAMVSLTDVKPGQKVLLVPVRRGRQARGRGSGDPRPCPAQGQV